MSLHADSSSAACEPTILETELDSICLTLSKMKKRLHRVPMLDHMSEAELIFTALAELSTRQIAETEKAKGKEVGARKSRAPRRRHLVCRRQ